LRQDDVCEFGEIEELRVYIEKLAQKRLETVEVYCGLWIEPFEIDIHHIHVLVIVSRRFQPWVREEGAYLVTAGIIVILLFALV
jgi:hypothetical protein